MAGIHKLLSHAFLVAVVALSSGCVVHDHDRNAAPADGNREGYFDREHNRYYHENAWHDCVDHDPNCK
jgi:hypothetical protein